MLKPPLSTLKILNILKWLLLVFFVIDLMWGPNGISVRYIAMILDNFSPF